MAAPINTAKCPPSQSMAFVPADFVQIRSRKNGYEAIKTEVPEPWSSTFKDTVYPNLAEQINHTRNEEYGNDTRIRAHARYRMYGKKHSNSISLEATILIQCTESKCRKLIDQTFKSHPPAYLCFFGNPWLVYTKGLYWSASSENNESPSVSTSAQGSSQFEIWLEKIADGAAAGGRLLKVQAYSLDEPSVRIARVGGIVLYRGKKHALTTGHTFLASSTSLESPLNAQRGSPRSQNPSESTASEDSDSSMDDYCEHVVSQRSDQQFTSTDFINLETAPDDLMCSFLGNDRIAGRPHQRTSAIYSDWALVPLADAVDIADEIRNVESAKQALQVMPQAGLTPGRVDVLCTCDTTLHGFLLPGTGFLQTSQGSLNVMEIKMENVLPYKISGCWVVRDSNILGHIVACSPDGLECYMLAMECVFDDIKVVTGSSPTLLPPGAVWSQAADLFWKAPSVPAGKAQRNQSAADMAQNEISGEGENIQNIYVNTDVSNGGLRLLRLLGGQSRELCGELVLREKLENPLQPYSALSYTWGTDARTAIMEILSENRVYKLKITPNLEAFLKQLKSEDSSAFPTVEYLWVDAICINQADIEERNLQVQRMGTIYSEAEKTIVWLGEAKQNSDRAIKFIPDVLKLHAKTLITDKIYIEDWDSFFNLLHRPWFSRRWVIQEIAFAQTVWVYCGSKKVLWDEFVYAVSLFSSMHKDILRLFQSSRKRPFRMNYLDNINELGAVRLIKTYNNLFRKSDDRGGRTRLLNLEQLVSRLPAFEASVPHDIIFAVLSLAADVGGLMNFDTASAKIVGTSSQDDGASTLSPPPRKKAKITHRARSLEKSPKEEFEELLGRGGRNRNKTIFLGLGRSAGVKHYDVDYGKSFYQVAQDFIERSMRTSESLDILCRPWAPKDVDEKLPSWISTLNSFAFKTNRFGVSQRIRADPLVGMPGEERNYNASGNYRGGSVFGTGAAEKRLFVDGFVLDEIAVKYLPAQSGDVPFEWLAACGWTDTLTLPPDKFWRTLVADRGPDGQNPPAYYRLACMRAYADGSDGDDLRTSEDAARYCQKVVAEFLCRVRAVVWRRCLISTKDYAMLGLVPSEAVKGDTICILYGCSVPVVLREMRDEVTKMPYHVLIGECYVYSMMETGAFNVRDAKLKALQEQGEDILTLTQRFELR